MSDQLKIKVTRRTDFGKGAARQARRAGLIPAVVYGHGQEPVHLLLPAQETTLAVRNPNALLTVVNEAGEEHLVLPKDIQRHAIKDTVDHLDLIEVRRGEKVVVEVTVQVEGEVAPGNEYVLDYVTVPVEADAPDGGFAVRTDRGGFLRQVASGHRLAHELHPQSAVFGAFESDASHSKANGACARAGLL